MLIPFFGLDRQYRKYRDEFLKLTDETLSSGQVLQGPSVRQLEETVAGICNRKHGVAVGSCTDALAFALIAMGIGPGDEVIVTSFSFFASVSPVLRVGAKPVFADIDPHTAQMDIRKLDALINKRVKAVIGVHLYGQTLDMIALEGFCRSRGLFLIEDSAQALGSVDTGRPAGNMGDVSCVSFDPTKVIGSFSSAGCLMADDGKIAETARELRYHGRNRTSLRYESLGFNSQLSSEMAAHLCFKLSKMEEWEKERAAIAGIYTTGLSGINGLATPAIRQGSSHNWHKYVIQADDRDNLASTLKDSGVQTMIHYPRPLCDEPAIQRLGLEPATTDVPVARAVSQRVLSLPIFAGLTEEEACRVVDSVKRHYEVSVN